MRLFSFFFLSSIFIFFYSPSHLSISISSSSSLSLVSSLVIYCVLFFSFSFSSLSHLTFPASFRYSLRLFSFFLFSDFRASWCSPHRFFFLFSCFLFTFFFSLVLFFFLSHLTFHAYLSLLSHYPLIDSEQCDKPLFLISVVPAVQFVRRNPPFSGQVIDFELLVRGTPPPAGQISVGTPAHLRRLPTAGNSVKLIDHVNGSATRLPP